MALQLYLLSQSVNINYDTYRNAVVAAASADDARIIHPGGRGRPDYDAGGDGWGRLEPKPGQGIPMWVTPDKVDVRHIGVADEGTPRGVVCADFMAG